MLASRASLLCKAMLMSKLVRTIKREIRTSHAILAKCNCIDNSSRKFIG